MNSLFSENFGQTVDLTQRIREVLTNYPEGTTILKELIQNADDASAKKISFCLDKRTHGKETLVAHSLAEFQGPSLLVHNDAQFTEEDFASISRIGDSKKRGKAWKTGRFGIGFNSVYHLTDLPSFVSGRYVVFFDPHTTFLPNISSVNPGKRVNFVESQALLAASNQFSPFLAFGCNMVEEFPATLFRFSLRTKEQASVSKLSKQSFSIEDMKKLLEDFQSEAISSILFLRNIESIELLEWSEGQISPKIKFSCNIKNSNETLRLHRQAHFRLAEVLASSGRPQGENATDVFSIEFECHKFENGTSHQVKESYLVSQSLGSPLSRIGSLVKHAKDYDVHLTPWASVAFRLEENQREKPRNEGFTGKAFCFLPLPVRTGLPVHVNGFFELSSNRRDIWYGEDMDRAGKLRSEWNKCLLEEVAAPAYVVLLLEAVKKALVNPSLVYDVFPGKRDYVEPWKGFVSKFYCLISNFPVLHTNATAGKIFPKSNGSWVTPSEAIYHDEEYSKTELLEGVLVGLNCPIVRPPSQILTMLLKFSLGPMLSESKSVHPRFVRSFLKEKRSMALASAESRLLLEYCLSDLLDKDVPIAMGSIALIPAVDLSLGTFTSSGGSECNDLILVHSEDEFEMLRERLGTKLHLLVDLKSMKREIYERLRNVAVLHRGGRLKCLTEHLLLKILPFLLPPEWKRMKHVKLQWDSLELKWLSSLWHFLSSKKCKLSKFEDWPLLPTQPSSLQQLDRFRPIVLEGEGWFSEEKEGREIAQNALISILEKLGCVILDKSFDCDMHPQIKSYVNQSSLKGLLTALDNVAFYSGSSLNGIVKVLSLEESVFLHSLIMGDWKAQVTNLDKKRVRLLKLLPIFPVHCPDLLVPLEGPDAPLLPPPGIHPLLLGPKFLRCDDQQESVVLTQFLEVPFMTSGEFYLKFVLNKFSSFPFEVRERAILTILKELPQLNAQEQGLSDSLRNLKFLPSAADSPTFHSPTELYDPRVPELCELLADPKWFPGKPFNDPDLLDMLDILGLNRQANSTTFLSVAKTIHELQNQGSEKCQEEAFALGKVLLRFLEVNAEKWIGRGRKAKEQTKLWDELSSLSWCPVLTTPPSPHMPWPTATPGSTHPLSSTAPPRVVRLAQDAWIVSGSTRVLAGECRSTALSEKFGWNTRPKANILAAQLLELGKLDLEKLNGEKAEGRKLTQTLASVVPLLYTLLAEVTSQIEWEVLQALLDGSPWVWMGDCFCPSKQCVFEGPHNLAPFLRVVPTDLVGFRDFLHRLGVRQKASPSELLEVMKKMAQSYGDGPLQPHHLDAAVWIAQQLSEAEHFRGETFLCPDTKAVLRKTRELVFNDAPWMGEEVAANLNYVHPLVSADVAEKLEARSLRRMILAESADSLELALHSSTEAFGQHEALTTRLKHIVDMYTDGPGVLCELLQNADDAGATEVKFLLDLEDHPHGSILGPRMGDWQGPALVAFNNAVFSQRDLQAISKVGQGSKLERPNTIGRFGLGFNSVYHLTDLPSFVSGSNLVFFDPHACHLPGVSADQPGLKISFVGKGLQKQFPDQFQPYLLFGCDLEEPFQGTLFRFPLRSSEAALRSQIKQHPTSHDQLLALFRSFEGNASETVLFLRNITRLSFHVKHPKIKEPELLYEVHRTMNQITARDPLLPVVSQATQSSPDPLHLFVRGVQEQPQSKDMFYLKLRSIPESQLPWSIARVVLTIGERRQTWIVCQKLGGGRAREMAVAPANKSHGFVPLAGAAALLSDSSNSTKRGDVPTMKGAVYCFLPLPIQTGLPVHVNGYFELSANRRDIWLGEDVGSGKTRAEWNVALLEDALAPAYARLLAEIAKEKRVFFSLWPKSAGLSEPWNSFAHQVFRSLISSGEACLFTPIRGGVWLSANEVIFPDWRCQYRHHLEPAVSHCGLPLVSAPEQVVQMFQNCRASFPSLSFLAPPLLRDLLRKPFYGDNAQAAILLRYCLEDCLDVNSRYGLGVENAGETLKGLKLVPMADGSFKEIKPASSVGHPLDSSLIVTLDFQFELFCEKLPDVLVDIKVDHKLQSMLLELAHRKTTNIRVFSAPLLRFLVPKILPRSWDKEESVKFPWDTEGNTPGVDLNLPISLKLFQGFWGLLESVCLEIKDLHLFEEWPIIPTKGNVCRRLIRQSPCIQDGNWSESLLHLFSKLGVAVIDSPIFGPSPPMNLLERVAEPASAAGVLSALGKIFFPSSSDAEVCPSLPSRKDILEIQNLPSIEKRELRRFILQGKWFTGPESLDQGHLDILKKLPIFDSPSFTASGDTDHFVDLISTQKYFAPKNLDEKLLGEHFVQVESEKEAQLLRLLGVKNLSNGELFLEFFLPTYSTLSTPMKVACSLAVLDEIASLIEPTVIAKEQEWPSLARELREVLKKLPCVCNDKGEFILPGQLYDPRNFQLTALLDSSFFPDKDLFPPSILPKLELLELRQILENDGILDCAKSIAVCQDNFLKCQKSGKALLQYLDERQRNEELGFDPDRLVEYIEKKRREEELFWADLKSIAWSPIVPLAPEPFLPWMKTGIATLTAPPCKVRPSEQMWQVSATFFILDGVIHSRSLPVLLGWSDTVSPRTLARQLVELSKSFTCLKRASELEKECLNQRVDILLRVSKVAFQLLFLLEDMVKSHKGGSHGSVIASTLSDASCIWVPEAKSFLEPKCLAFMSPQNIDFRPFLYIVPPELENFHSLLALLGVGNDFTMKSYLGALSQLSSDTGGLALSDEQLAFCVQLLEVLDDTISVGRETKKEQLMHLGEVLLPNFDGCLMPSTSLVYKDIVLPEGASDSILVTRSLVHPSVPSSVASSLGAKSLRYLSLVDHEMTETLPCVPASRLSKLLTFWGDSEALLFDLLEIADIGGVSQVDLVYDKREHGVKSLLQPNLAPFQGSAFSVFLPGVHFSQEDVMALQSVKPKPWGPFNSFCQYSSGLLGAYHLSDLLVLSTPSNLFLFDPSATILAGHGSPRDNYAVGKAYKLRGTEVAQQFSDQFQPLIPHSDSCPRGYWEGGTVIRLPIRTAKLAASSALKHGEEFSEGKLVGMVEALKSKLTPSLLFLLNLSKVRFLVWDEANHPTLKWSVEIENKKKISDRQLGSEFVPQTRTFCMEILKQEEAPEQSTFNDEGDTEGGKNSKPPATCSSCFVLSRERWLLSQGIGSGQSKERARSSFYSKFKLRPVGEVATLLLRDGVPVLGSDFPDLCSGYGPFPLAVPFGQPFHFGGQFMVLKEGGRILFPSSIEAIDEIEDVKRKEQFRSAAFLWNQDLLTCVKDALLALISDIATTKQGFISRSIMEGMYSLWPHSETLPIQGESLHLKVFQELTIKPFYMEAAQLPLWSAHDITGLAKADTCCFLSPLPPVEHQISDYSGSSNVESFDLKSVVDFMCLHRQYTIFSGPFRLLGELKRAGEAVNELSPMVLRALCKTSPHIDNITTLHTQVDILEYCILDLLGESGQLNKDSMMDLVGIRAPLSDGSMASIGREPLLIASLTQLNLLTRKSIPALHPVCLQRPLVKAFLENDEVQSHLKLTPFSPAFLARQLPSLLPGVWVESPLPWVKWNISDPTHPTYPWLRDFWDVIELDSESLAVFEEWPLIPASIKPPSDGVPVGDEKDRREATLPLILVKVRCREMVFLPTSAQSQAPESGPSSSSSALDSLAELEQNYPMLTVDTLRRLRIPVLDVSFSDTLLSLLLKESENSRSQLPSLGHLILSKLVARHKFDSVPLSATALASSESCALWNLFSFQLCRNQAGLLEVPQFSAEEAEALRELPIHKNIFGNFLSIHPDIHYFLGPDPLLQLEEEACLDPPQVDCAKPFYTSLSVRKLSNDDILVELALPRFARLNGDAKETVLEYILSHWSLLRTKSAVVDILRETSFVLPRLDPQSGTVERVRPCDLFDPASPTFSRVFEDQPFKFPGDTFSSPRWLRLLSELGLKASVNENILVECAQHLQSRAIAMRPYLVSQQLPYQAGFPSASTVFQSCAKESFIEVDCNLWELGVIISKGFLSMLGKIVGSYQGEEMCTLMFLPCVFGKPCSHPPNNALDFDMFGNFRRVLSSFQNVVLEKHWPLAWSVAPVLALKTLELSPVVCRALKIQAPTFPKILLHLKTVGSEGGEGFLFKWPNRRESFSVEETVDYVLKHLQSIWDRLSVYDKRKLEEVNFIPVSNGTCLVSPRQVFQRLPFHLAPLAFELPVALLPYSPLLADLGMQPEPSIGDLVKILVSLKQRQQDIPLNPNEVKSVVNLLNLLHTFTQESNSPLSIEEAALLAVPDHESRLIPASACCFLDPNGLSFLPHIDISHLQFAHPSLPASISSTLGISSFTSRVQEILDPAEPLQMILTLGDCQLDALQSQLSTSDFAERVWLVVEETFLNQSSDRQAWMLDIDKKIVHQVVFTMGQSLRFVKTLSTKFHLLPDGLDITKSENKPQVFFFVEKKGSGEHAIGTVYIAEPPPCVPLSSLLAAALSQCLSSPSVLPLAALFQQRDSLPSSKNGLNDALRLGGKHIASSIMQPMESRGLPGETVHAMDISRLRCLPLRPFPSGEIVVWSRSISGFMDQVLSYGKVVKDSHPPAGQPVYLVEVEVAPGEVKGLLSTSIATFATPFQDRQGGGELMSLNGGLSASSGLERRGHSGEEVDNVLVNNAQGRKEQSLYDIVPAKEVVGAVTGMLSAIGLPLGLTQQQLMEQVLKLQATLETTQASLDNTQQRVDTLECEIEEANSTWLCKVCQILEVNLAVQPCGHLLCMTCVSSIANKRCPFCRTNVSSTLQVYHG